MAGTNAFTPGVDPWLARLGNLRNVMRQGMVAPARVSPTPASGARVLDIGAGQGTQTIRLARAGFAVSAVEPDEC